MPRAASEHDLTRPSFWRFRIGHLFLLTLGIALGLWVWRLRGQPAIKVGTNAIGYDPDLEAIALPVNIEFGDLGNWLVPVVFWTILGLLAPLLRHGRVAHDSGTLREQEVVPPRLGLLGRLAMAVCLALYLVLTVELHARRPEGWGIYELREQWLAQSGAMLLVGLMLVTSAVRPAPPRAARGGWLGRFRIGGQPPGWVRALGTVLLGILALGLMTEEMFIAYLTLISVFGISLAVRPGILPMERIDPTYRERFVEALGPLTVTLVLMLVCVAWAVHVTRQSRRSGRAPTRRQWGLHAVLLLFLLAAGTDLVAGTIPCLSRFIAEGLASLLDPVNVGIVVVGTAGMSAGIAMQIAVSAGLRSPTDGELHQAAPVRPRGRRAWWIVRLIVGLIVAGIIATCAYLEQKMSMITFNWIALGMLARTPILLAAVARTLLIWQRPLVWIFALVVMGTRILAGHVRAARRGPPETASRLPAHSPTTVPLFWMWWLSITVLMLTAVPTLGLAAFLGFHGEIELGW